MKMRKDFDDKRAERNLIVFKEICKVIIALLGIYAASNIIIQVNAEAGINNTGDNAQIMMDNTKTENNFNGISGSIGVFNGNVNNIGNVEGTININGYENNSYFYDEVKEVNFGGNEYVKVFKNGEYIRCTYNEAKAYITAFSPNSIIGSDVLKGWNSENGYQYVLMGEFQQDYGDKQPILWRVLYTERNKALLLSEVILDTRPYDDNSNNWETSEIREWLNNDFYFSAFSEKEKNAIIQNNTLGNIFLPSKEELTEARFGFNKSIDKKDKNRVAFSSTYALDNSLWTNDELGSSSYYTRTERKENLYLVCSEGNLLVASVNRDNVGIRPAMWVNIDDLPFSHGDGTIIYPYQ